MRYYKNELSKKIKSLDLSNIIMAVAAISALIAYSITK